MNAKTLGSLTDDTIRLDMENQIFRKLQTAIENPCRSKEWFGMAEQAINNVYALGSHPDVFCNDLIKTFTRRVFMRQGNDRMGSQNDDVDEQSQSQTYNESMSTQSQSFSGQSDVTDTFELSQLLFIVGHVAMKHIVYFRPLTDHNFLMSRFLRKIQSLRQLILLSI